MKKLIAVAAVALSAAFARADITWSWWMEHNLTLTDISLGLASKCMSVGSLELSLLYSASPVSRGVQLTVFGINDSDSDCALQLAPWFNRGGDPCVQLGFINAAETTTFTMGLVNVADRACVQLGFLNFNGAGFLPFFPFVNLDPSIFK